MFAELLELCLEPKRINYLKNLENLFPDCLDNEDQCKNQFLFYFISDCFMYFLKPKNLKGDDKIEKYLLVALIETFKLLKT